MPAGRTVPLSSSDGWPILSGATAPVPAVTNEVFAPLAELDDKVPISGLNVAFAVRDADRDDLGARLFEVREKIRAASRKRLA